MLSSEKGFFSVYGEFSALCLEFTHTDDMLAHVAVDIYSQLVEIRLMFAPKQAIVAHFV